MSIMECLVREVFKMILNIGRNKYLYKRDILFILNSETVKMNKEFQVFLNKIKNEGYFFGVEDECVKSYIILNKNSITHVYSSIISSKTLSQRSSFEKWR